MSDVSGPRDCEELLSRNAMRAAIRGKTPGPDLIPEIEAVLEQFGTQPAEKVVPLTPIAKDDVRLLAWMAVTGKDSAMSAEASQ